MVRTLRAKRGCGTNIVPAVAPTLRRVRRRMRTDTHDPTSPENTSIGQPILAQTTVKGWPHVHDRRQVITRPIDLAKELIRRIDINRELRDAGIDPTQEDRESLSFLCHQWDRLRMLRSGGISKPTTGGLGRGSIAQSKRGNGKPVIPSQTKSRKNQR